MAVAVNKKETTTRLDQYVLTVATVKLSYFSEIAV